VVIPPYLADGDVTINFSWVRRHHPLVVDVLVFDDCQSLWPDICAELSAKYAPALEAGRFPEHWLLSPAGRTAVYLVVEALVQAYKASELCAVTSRLRAMVQVSAPPAVSVPVGHPGSHHAAFQGADSHGVAVPVLTLPPTTLGSDAGSVLGSVPAVARRSSRLPAQFTGVTSDSLAVLDWLYHMEAYLNLSQAPHPVLIASQNLSGPASEWWLTQGRHVAGTLSDWDVFRTARMGRFASPADSHATRRELQTVCQPAGQSVNDFMTQLNRLKSRILIGDPITPSELAGHFWRCSVADQHASQPSGVVPLLTCKGYM
jgi:Retrotransposon gag protein